MCELFVIHMCRAPEDADGAIGRAPLGRPMVDPHVRSSPRRAELPREKNV